MEEAEDPLLTFDSPAAFGLPFPAWETAQCMEIGSMPAFFEDGFSTGYLQDALFQFRPSAKRRRSLMFAGTDRGATLKNSSAAIGDGDIFCHELNGEEEAEGGEEETSSEAYAYDSSSSSQNLASAGTPEKTNMEDSVDRDPPFSSSSGSNDDQKPKTRVVYPFTVVKQGGFEGAATINDINRRILMTPTKPLRHPVGEFACRPLILPHGPGLSGKAVVAFKRIQTPGRGTITIVRTRG